MPSTRRSLLAAGVTALASVAGCFGSGTGSPATATTDSTSSDRTTVPPADTTSDSRQTTRTDGVANEFGTPAAVEEHSVTPTGAHVQHSLVYLKYADAMDVFDPADRQFLFVDVAVEGDNPPAPGAFALRVGEATHRGWTDYDVGGPKVQLAPDDRRTKQYEPAEPTGWVGFDLPVAVSAEAIRLRFEGAGGSAAWTLPSEQATALRATPPDFEVRSVEVPERVPASEGITPSLTVANTGDGPGAFRFAINHGGPTIGASAHSLVVRAGETRTWAEELVLYDDLESSEVSFTIETSEEAYDFTVEVGS